MYEMFKTQMAKAHLQQRNIVDSQKQMKDFIIVEKTKKVQDRFKRAVDIAIQDQIAEHRKFVDSN